MFNIQLVCSLFFGCFLDRALLGEFGEQSITYTLGRATCLSSLDMMVLIAQAVKGESRAHHLLGGLGGYQWRCMYSLIYLLIYLLLYDCNDMCLTAVVMKILQSLESLLCPWLY